MRNEVWRVKYFPKRKKQRLSLLRASVLTGNLEVVYKDRKNKMMGIVQEQNMEKHIEKQMGCMAGFLQIFDRHQIITGKRLYATRRLPSSMVSYSLLSDQYVFFALFMSFFLTLVCHYLWELSGC